jgi:hypothetical protein
MPKTLKHPPKKPPAKAHSKGHSKAHATARKYQASKKAIPIVRRAKPKPRPRPKARKELPPSKAQPPTNPQPRSIEMTNVQTPKQPREKRGAGTGEEAVKLRQLPPREAVPPVVESTEYPEGEIDKGRIDYEAQAEGFVADVIPMRDRRAYLLDQAEKNQAANDELNAIQTEQNRNVQFVQSQLQDPDVMRENSMETAIAALEEHSNERDPAVLKAQQVFRQKQLSGETVEDHQPGNNRTVQGTPAADAESVPAK